MDVALSQPQLRYGVVHSGDLRRAEDLFDSGDGQAHNSQTFSLSAGVGAFVLTIQLHHGLDALALDVFPSLGRGWLSSPVNNFCAVHNGEIGNAVVRGLR